MLIQVTEKNIALGSRNDPQCCPVARAMFDAGYHNACVSEKRIVLDYKLELKQQDGQVPEDSSNSIRTPDPVRRRISYYDNTGKMKPFSFELQVNAT